MLNLDPSKKYLLACSFGPDSMALFFLLQKEGFLFDVAHVNYHLREESNFEEESLRQFCAINSINIYVKSNEEIFNNNIEENCRELRYCFFKNLCDKNNYDGVLVAHHQDDVIETYILQNKRQILPKCYGIAEFSYIFGVKVIRPLLNYTKMDLLNICKENKIPFAIDKTNLKDTFERNKIRHEIIENLTPEKRNQYLKEILGKNKCLQDATISIENLQPIINEEFLNLCNVKLAMYFTKLARQVEPDFELSLKAVLELKKILKSDKPNVVFPIAKGVTFHKEYDKFFFSRQQKDDDYIYIVDKPCKLDTPYFSLDFTGDTSNRHVSLDDYPLIIRNAKPNDKIQIKDYYCSARRLFIDWKMPLSFRKRWPIIISNKSYILYIPRYQKDFVGNESVNFVVK